MADHGLDPTRIGQFPARVILLEDLLTLADKLLGSDTELPDDRRELRRSGRSLQIFDHLWLDAVLLKQSEGRPTLRALRIVVNREGAHCSVTVTAQGTAAGVWSR